MKTEPGAITLASGARSRYKLEIFPRIWLKSDRPSWWERFGYLLCFGKLVVKLPPIETCNHKFEIKESRHYSSNKIEFYNFCPICELEEPIEEKV